MHEDHARALLLRRRLIMKMRQHQDASWHIYTSPVGNDKMRYLCSMAALASISEQQLIDALSAPEQPGEYSSEGTK